MSWQAQWWAWSFGEKDGLTSTTKLVLLALGGHADAQGRNCFPSYDTLSRETLLCRRTVISAMWQLLEEGFVSRVSEHKGGRTIRNEYLLNMDLTIIARKGSVPKKGSKNGAGDAPFRSERVQDVHPLAESEGPERVQEIPLNGAADAPEPVQTPKGRKGRARDAQHARARNSPFPSDFEPDEEGRAFASGLGLDAQSVFEHFRDHRLANGIEKPDWDADWRVWCRREARDHHAKPNGASKQPERRSGIPGIANPAVVAELRRRRHLQ